MNDIERALQAAMTTELDRLEMPDRLPHIRQRARRERLFLAAAGGVFLLVTGLVVFWSASALNTSERDKGVVNPAPTPSQEATTFGRFAISFGGGFNRQGEPIEGTGIVEIDSKLGTACFEASILGSTSAHLHRDGQTDAVVTFFEPPQKYRPNTCVDQQAPEVLQQITDNPANYYIEFHSSASGGRLVSDLEPFVEAGATDNPECPEGIEGRGLGEPESYPPKPYFEAFNLWRTESRATRRGCFTVVAGQQQSHASDGENDPTTYEPNGWLFIFGDYRRDPDGITTAEVPLPRPVRVIGYSGRGFKAVLRLQSLADCSTIAYDVGSAAFIADTFEWAPPCPQGAGQ